MTAWSFVETFQKHPFDGDEDASSPVKTVTFKQLLQTLRTFDPDITHQQIEWVLGKEDSTGSTAVTFDEVWANLEDGDLERLDIDPLEQSFARLADERQEYLDLKKIGTALHTSGIHGVTDDIMGKCTRSRGLRNPFPPNDCTIFGLRNPCPSQNSRCFFHLLQGICLVPICQ